MKSLIKKYLIYSGWAIVFYSTFSFIAKIFGRNIPAAVIFILALAVAALLKKYLPFLKHEEFYELAPFLEVIREHLFGFNVRPRTCEVCGLKTDFKVIIEYRAGKDLTAKKHKTLCRTHGVIELRKIVERYQIIIIFTEPDIKGKGGSFFYEPAQLKARGYLAEDRVELEKLITQFPKELTYEKVLWLAKDTVSNYPLKPLFKKKSPGEYISMDELVKRLRAYLENLETKFKKGEYWFSEPHGKSGIYIYNNKV